MCLLFGVVLCDELVGFGAERFVAIAFAVTVNVNAVFGAGGAG